jgi:hypothetical protein
MVITFKQEDTIEGQGAEIISVKGVDKDLTELILELICSDVNGKVLTANKILELSTLDKDYYDSKKMILGEEEI